MKESMDKMEIKAFFEKFSFLCEGENPFIEDINEVEIVGFGTFSDKLMERKAF